MLCAVTHKKDQPQRSLGPELSHYLLGPKVLGKLNIKPDVRYIFNSTSHTALLKNFSALRIYCIGNTQALPKQIFIHNMFKRFKKNRACPEKFSATPRNSQKFRTCPTYALAMREQC